MEQIIKEVIKKMSCDYAEIRIEEKQVTCVYFSGKEIEKIGTDFILGGNVRVCHKGGWSFISFNDLKNVEKAAIECINTAKKIGTKKTNLKKIPNNNITYKSKFKIDPRKINLKEKEKLCRSVNNFILSHNDIINSSILYRDEWKKQLFANSEGSFTEQEIIHTGASIGARIRDGNNIQNFNRTWGDQNGFENVNDYIMLNEAENVIKIIRDLIKAPKVEGNIYTVIIDPELTGVFAHEAFGHLSESDFLYENEEMKKKMIIGRKFGRDFLNIIDDGSIEGERGFIPFDDEGVASRKNYLIKNGILHSRLHSRETAGLMNEETSGNARAINYAYKPIVRMTNTIIEAGKYTLDEMLDGIKDGLYVAGVLGGETDLEKFTFSAKYAHIIKNGKIKEMVRDVILSGNVFDTLMNIEMIGNDLKIFGGLGGCGKNGQFPLPISDGGPHIKINNVIIGGK